MAQGGGKSRSGAVGKKKIPNRVQMKKGKPNKAKKSNRDVALDKVTKRINATNEQRFIAMSERQKKGSMRVVDESELVLLPTKKRTATDHTSARKALLKQAKEVKT